ncbi:porin [Shewanella atlantica]|uniref:Porin n=1 Tax=Shewanella atlantica TaxID=271099 RepID=A0A3S0IFW7_9GAMM|nr:porin [Shewanella atlantica]RTR34569.1 porin [Shewanella atlantica]
MRNHIIANLIIIVICVGAFSTGAVGADITLESLKLQIETLQKQVEQLEKAQLQAQQQQAQEKQVQVAAPVVEPRQVSPSKAMDTPEKTNNTISAYATMRPTFGYIDEDGDSFYDVRDALSRAGIRATNEFMPGWTAELHGEWSIDMANSGDFGKARKAYAAVASPYGRVGIGKDRPPQYLLIAEYVDIFNHANSPFAYDAESVFFVDNMLTYRLQTGKFSWLAAGQFDGGSGSDDADLVNLGVGFDHGEFHGAISYLVEDSLASEVITGEDEVWAASLAHGFANGLYLAAAYQERTYKRDLISQDRDGHTIDLAAAYPLGEQFKVKLGYFEFDDGYGQLISRKFDGYNTTLEWLPDENLRFHIEYLYRDMVYFDDFSSWVVGFRYDFAKDWRF